jgi:protein disulfide-isomerase
MRTAAKLRAAIVLGICSIALLTSGTANAQIAWQTNLQAAHAQAKAEGKLLLLHFYSDNCVYCDRLEAGSFKSPQVGQAINTKYVPVKIHGGNNAHLTKMFKVTKYPTDVIVGLDGATLSHSVSPQEPARYVAMLAGATQPKAPSAADVSASQAPKSQEISMPVQVPTQTAAAGPQVNQFAVKQTEEPKTAIAPTNKSNSAGIPAKMVSAKTVTNDKPVSPEAPSLKPELAMQGFCPVTVIKKDQWVEGNPKLGVIHLGKLYLFADADAMETFLADPVPFTPVLNEIDVVRYFEERRIVQGKREWGLKDPTHNRMFFFADEAAMNHFWNEYERYTGPAIKVMEKAVQDANPGT